MQSIYDQVDQDYDVPKHLHDARSKREELELGIYSILRALRAADIQEVAIEVGLDGVAIVNRNGRFPVKIKDVWRAIE